MDKTFASYVCLVIFNLYLGGVLVVGYPTGAPDNQCTSMTPSHGANTFQSSDSPYLINVNVVNGIIHVTIVGFLAKINGFIASAFNPSGALVGKFLTVMDNPNTHFLCEKPSITHSGHLQATALVMTWSPEDYFGNVTFKATVVKDFNTYWSLSKIFAVSETTSTSPPPTTAAPVVTSAATDNKEGTAANPNTTPNNNLNGCATVQPPTFLLPLLIFLGVLSHQLH